MEAREAEAVARVGDGRVATWKRTACDVKTSVNVSSRTPPFNSTYDKGKDKGKDKGN